MTTDDSTSFIPQPHPTNPRFIDITGQKFGLLFVIGFYGSQGNRAMWACVCECGKSAVAAGHLLRNGHTKSCGHLQAERRAAGNPVHGGCGTREYEAYLNAKMRCQNPNIEQYKDYGGRGIEFRFTSFQEFIDHIGYKLLPNLTLDRKNVNGHYELGNVRWADWIIQGRNKTNNRVLTINSVSKSLVEWAANATPHRRTITSRIQRGWCDECAVMLPLHSRCHLNIA